MAAAVASGLDFGLDAFGHVDLEETPRKEVATELQQMVMGCNKDGMEFLRKGQYKQAFEQLKYAEAVLDAQGLGENEPSSLLAVTCNNLGCYYKKVGKLHAALSYLRKALKLELSLQTDDATVAGTHLNVCAILSKLDKHDKAVKHAECALQLVVGRISAVGDVASSEEHQLLAIAYHNVAVEQDYLHQWDSAAQAYQQGYQVAKRCLGDQHPLTQTLGKHCESAAQKSQKFARDRPSGTAPADLGDVRGGRRPGEEAALPRHPFAEAGARTASPSLGAEPSATLPDISGAGNLRITKDLAPGRVATAPRAVMPGTGPRLEAAEWAQPGAASQWQPATPRQLPPLASSAVPAVAPGRYMAAGGHFMAAAPSADLIGGFTAEPSWKMETNPQVRTSAFMDRLVQDVPAAAHFAAAAPEPPPLVYVAGAGASAAAASRQARAKAREVQQHQPHQAAPELPKPQDAVLPRRGPSNFVPAPPSTGRPRPGGAPVAHRGQRELCKASRHLPPGSLTADQALAGGLPGGLRPQQSQLLRRSAAEKIQKAWRAYYGRRTTVVRGREQEQRAATKIQARWRGFRVVYRRRRKAAVEIQRWARGYIVRRRNARLSAAIRIERQARGMLARRRLRIWANAITKIQTIVRRKLARIRVQARRQKYAESTLLLQCAWRRKEAYMVVAQERAQLAGIQARHDAATKIQKVHRGGQGRARFNKAKDAHEAVEAQHAAATKLQSMTRAHVARIEVRELRRVKRERQDKASSTMRKYFLRYIFRKRYLYLKKEFVLHVDSITTIQRYVRGFVVRSKMWKDAIRAEEELWAAVELQRCWRGYAGRLRWAREYEYVTSRDRAARRLQRCARGFVARARLRRIRQRKARAQFELAHARFNAAQRIQALVRGVQCRARMCARLRRRRDSAVKIQSVFRGHQYRERSWEKLVDKRTAQIQAAMRGFLVRNRRFHLLVRIICIQTNYRKFLRYVPEEERRHRVEAWRVRRAQARGALAAEAAATGG